MVRTPFVFCNATKYEVMVVYLYHGTAYRVALSFFAGFFTGRVTSHGLGRATVTRPDLTRPDPVRFENHLVGLDPPHETS